MTKAKAPTLEEQFGPLVPLDPELEACFHDGVIHHPLVISACHADVLNGMMNRQLTYKREKIAECSAAGKWGSVVFLHERPYRLDAFQSIPADAISDEDYWQILGDVWTDSENIWQCYDVWRLMLSSERSSRELIMDADECEILAGMPDEIEVFRGFNSKGTHNGMSWSTDRERAEWFAKRFAKGDAQIASGMVKKSDVIAHFMCRGEDEIVVFPENVSGVLIEAVA